MPRRRRSRTTLERRGRLIFGVFILLTVVACLSWPWLQMDRLARSGDSDLARAKAEALLLEIHAVRFAADEKSAEQLRRFARTGGEKPKLAPLAPAPPGRDQQPPADLASFEAEAFEALLLHPQENHYFEERGDRFRYVQAFRATGECLACHSDYARGAILAIAGLEVDVAERNRLLLVHRLILMGAAVCVVVISMALFYGVFRTMVVRPVQHLKDVADRVSEGDLQVRTEIDTGNELQDLSDAMNHMLDQMLETQKDLRRATEVRDAKLDELAKANVALFEMNQVKSKFVTTMSHELRTPLNSILGFAQLLGDSEALSEDPKLARYIGNIQTSGRMLLEMINDLLDLAKIEAGRVQVRCEKVSPQDLVEVVMNMVRPMLADKEIAFGHRVDPATPVMVTDATKVQQILYNLLSNAVKFTDAGEVQLEVGPAEDERVVFQVRDTGPGIPREQQLRIFERFTQLDASYTRRYRGTGLGLSIVKELTALLGGDVEVESEVGRGSTFTVVLPADSSEAEGRTPGDAEAEAAPEPAEAAPPAPSAPGRPDAT